MTVTHVLARVLPMSPVCTEEMPDPFYEDCFVKVARVEFLSDVEVGFVRYRGRSPESPSIRASLKTAPHAAYA
jgi:hypothetical protein